MDGLIIDSEPVYKRAWQAACKEVGFNLTEDGHTDLKGRGRKFALQRVYEVALIAGVKIDLEKFVPILNNHEQHHFNDEPLPTKHGLEDLLTFLETHNFLRAVGTSAYTATAKKCLQSIGIYNKFHAVVGVDQVDRGKPFPDIFLEAQRLLSVQPDECIVLEDSEHGIEAAKSAGMFAIRIPDGLTIKEVKHTKADLMLETLKDVILLLRS